MKILKSWWMTALLLFAVVALSANLGAVAAWADTGVEPANFSATLNPGESASFNLSAITGAKPIPSIDVAFAIDCTGSMSDIIVAAKAKALEVMANIRTLVPDSNFGLAHFMDYPASYVYPGYSNEYGNSARGDVAYQVDQPITSDMAAVAAGINGLTENGYGGDWPQDYTRVLYELLGGTPESGGMIGWRTTSKKLVIMLGDAPTHDLNFADMNFGGDPGRDGIAMTADDLDFETVVAQLKAQNISVLALDCNEFTDESAATLKGMSIGFATAPGTNGQYSQLADASQISEAITQMVNAAVSTISNLTLNVPAEFASWVAFTPQEYTDVGPNTTETFTVTVTVPPGTPPGDYTFPINVLGDGAFLGATQVTITVPSHPALTLTKTADKNTREVGDTAKYTLTVKNTGDVALHNVTVNDPDLTWDGSNTADTLAVGASKVFTGTYKVTETDWRNGAKHVNNATATTTEGASAQASCTVKVNPAKAACGLGCLGGCDTKRFGFEGSDKACQQSPCGRLSFKDHSKQCQTVDIESTGCTSLRIPDNVNRADMSGTCTFNGNTGYSFRLLVEDKSGSGSPDSFSLTMCDSKGAVVYQNQDTPSWGDIKVCH